MKKNNIPNGVERYLNDAELQFLDNIINDNNKKLLMRESRDMNAEDFAKVVKKIMQLKGMKN